ncbi:FtsX-like permease family protein [Rhizohabitans arisaemae]|uniref:ABC transporter permease n=1 Tax=Rhizohabitans arisaemae TaxID=2720610 RepID=UPI0024B167BA|nr:ABC transporter permease [Rhizohabitans arisaemae]
MGRILLILRLAARDLRRRPGEAALLVLAIATATASLTVGMVLQGVVSRPYESTRAATSGPDVIASVTEVPHTDPARLEALTAVSGVVAHSGPYPYTEAVVAAKGVTVGAYVQGRTTTPAVVDQPKVVEGGWVRDGGAVVEASFASALGLGTGDRITVGSRSFQVVGVAATASAGPYPKHCFAPCWSTSAAGSHLPKPPPKQEHAEPPPQPDTRGLSPGPRGLIWTTESDVGLVSGGRFIGYVAYLKLADPAKAWEFVGAHLPAEVNDPFVVPWQDVLDGHGWLVEAKRTGMILSAWLLGLIALGSIAVLVGGRMADQFRRVGLLKAVGGTPGLVAAVLLAEHVAVALVATVPGLAVGRAVAPLLTDPGAGLLGGAGAVPFTASTVAVVVAAALGIAGVATFVPAVRAARTSTVRALANEPRPPRRSGWLIAASARLPVPLLLGLRVAARRPRRTVLGVAGIAVTVTGVVATLAVHANRYAEKAPGVDPRTGLSQVLVLMTIMLIVQAAVNAVCVIWATTLDSRWSSALARALGATPGQVSAGLSAAQMLPTLAGSLLGLVMGIGLAEFLDDDPVTVPPWWQLLAVVVGCVVVVAALTAVPARIAARRPAGEILRTEHA